MLRQVCRLGGRNTLAHDVRGLSGSQPESPNFIALGTVEISPKILAGDGARPISPATGDTLAVGVPHRRIPTKRLRIKSTLAEDVRHAHNRVLDVRTGFTLEAQGIFEVKRDHRRLGVLQHEKTQRADGDLS